MLKKLEMTIPSELLGLSDINILEIYLRDSRELIIKVESIQLSFRSSFFRFLFFLFAKNNVTLQNEIYFN